MGKTPPPARSDFALRASQGQSRILLSSTSFPYQLTKRGLFSYRFLGTIAQVTVTWDIKRLLSSYISKRQT